MPYLWLILGLWSSFALAKPRVVMESNLGNIVLELNEERAPATVANFLKYVQAGFYDRTLIHRVIPGFVIQGGGYDVDGREKSTFDPIANESHHGLSNGRFSIAMARTSDPHSATSQFFINLADNPQLNPHGIDPYGYAVFGQVVDGFRVLESMARVPTHAQAGLGQDVPQQSLWLQRVYVQEEALPAAGK